MIFTLLNTHGVINLQMADTTATVLRPVPWDGSFTPLAPYLPQPSQPPKAESVEPFLCERCRAFATQLEATQRLKFKFEKTWIKNIYVRFLGMYFTSISFFSFYETWNEFYQSYARGCHLCTIIFLSLSQDKDATLKEINEESTVDVANVRLRWRRSGEHIHVEPQVGVDNSILAVGSTITLQVYPCAWRKC
jgi:hypothetical protein